MFFLSVIVCKSLHYWSVLFLKAILHITVCAFLSGKSAQYCLCFLFCKSSQYCLCSSASSHIAVYTCLQVLVLLSILFCKSTLLSVLSASTHIAVCTCLQVLVLLFLLFCKSSHHCQISDFK